MEWYEFNAFNVLPPHISNFLIFHHNSKHLPFFFFRFNLVCDKTIRISRILGRGVHRCSQISSVDSRKSSCLCSHSNECGEYKLNVHLTEYARQLFNFLILFNKILENQKGEIRRSVFSHYAQRHRNT